MPELAPPPALAALLVQKPALLTSPTAPRYRLADGRVLESVTDVLRGVGLVREEWYTGVGRMRGQAVHKACYLFDLGVLDWESLKPIEEVLQEPVEPYVRGWGRFRRETGYRPWLMELALYHPGYLYAGRLDSFGEYPDGSLDLVDIKTYSPEPAVELQLGGYSGLLDAAGFPYRGLRAVELTRVGDFKLHLLKSPTAFFDFSYALAHLRWRKTHGYA